MNRFTAFLRLIRWINLLFIIVAQYLFRYAIVEPVFHHYGVDMVLSEWQFLLVVLATLLIAAGGYSINDYFDVKIDQINKPDRLVVDRVFSRRQAILANWILTLGGVLLGGMVATLVGRWHLGGVFLLSAIALWFYSARFKRQPLIGNVVVSLLTALTIVVVALFEIWILHRPEEYDAPAGAVLTFVVLYGGFAFLISMVREIVKDMEDVQGDESHRCRTLPVVAGIRVARQVALVFGIVLLVNLVILSLLEWRDHNWEVAVYGIVAVIVPWLYVLWLLSRADTRRQFGAVSGWVKAVMLAGILSMLMIRFFDAPYLYFLYGT